MALSSSAREGETPLIQNKYPHRIFEIYKIPYTALFTHKAMSMHLHWPKEKRRGWLTAFPPVLRQY